MHKMQFPTQTLFTHPSTMAKWVLMGTISNLFARAQLPEGSHVKQSQEICFCLLLMDNTWS